MKPVNQQRACPRPLSVDGKSHDNDVTAGRAKGPRSADDDDHIECSRTQTPPTSCLQHLRPLEYVITPPMATALGLLLFLVRCFVPLAALAAAVRGDATRNSSLISQELFWELEELARIVDITYCVGTAGLGIQKPFQCASRCGDGDFETFELVTVRPPLADAASVQSCRAAC